jgi:hypothetical protein
VGGTVTGTFAVGQTIWVAPKTSAPIDSGVPARSVHITALGSGTGSAGTYTLSGSPGTFGTREVLAMPDLISGIYLHAGNADVTGYTVSRVSLVNANSPLIWPISSQADAHNITNLLIKDNYIQQAPSIGVPLTTGNQCIGMAKKPGFDFNNPQILNNNCVGSGVQVLGVNGGIFSGNNVEQFAYGAALWCVDFYGGPTPQGKSWIVSNNHLHHGINSYDVSGQGTPMQGIEWHCPSSNIVGNVVNDNAGPGITNSGDNVGILANVIYNNAAQADNPYIQAGIFLEAIGPTGNNNIGTVISGNNVYDDGPGNQKYALAIGGSISTNAAITLAANRLQGITSDILNNATNGNAVYAGVYLPNISGTPAVGGVSLRDDNLVYGVAPTGTGVVNIRAGAGGTDYYFSFRGNGEFDTGTLHINNIAGSAGAGGLYLCIDSAGATYRKASCP